MTIKTSHRCNLFIKTIPKRKISKSITRKRLELFFLQEMVAFTLPWTSYLIEPSSSAPNSISLEIVVLMSVTVNDSSEEYPFSLGICSLHENNDIHLCNDLTQIPQ